MLWRKSFLESRWRFFIGLAVCVAMSVGIVLSYPYLLKMFAKFGEARQIDSQELREAIEITRNYSAFVWSNLFGKNLMQVWICLAILIGVGGIMREASHGTGLFTLSLPVTRQRLLAVRTITGLIELLIIAVLPSLLVPVASLAIGKTFPIKDALIYSLSIVVGGSVFLTMSILLSTLFRDDLKPITIGFCAALLLGLLFQLRALAPYSIFAIMAGEPYYRIGSIPWTGLTICAGVAAVMYYVALRVLERRDF